MVQALLGKNPALGLLVLDCFAMPGSSNSTLSGVFLQYQIDKFGWSMVKIMVNRAVGNPTHLKNQCISAHCNQYILTVLWRLNALISTLQPLFITICLLMHWCDGWTISFQWSIIEQMYKEVIVTPSIGSDSTWNTFFRAIVGNR